MAAWSDLHPLERLPNRLRKSPYTVGVSESMTEVAMEYWEATLNVADQFFVPTATWGLAEWERLVGITPAAGATLESRRSAVIAKLCSTGTTGKYVSEATGLHIQRFLSGEQGGDQQIAARIACNEIDLLLFFRDSMQAQQPEPPYDKNLLRLCDVHNIPVATNIATAEVLIHGLERGDLDWREIVKL